MDTILYHILYVHFIQVTSVRYFVRVVHQRQQLFYLPQNQMVQLGVVKSVRTDATDTSMFCVVFVVAALVYMDHSAIPHRLMPFFGWRLMEWCVTNKRS